MKVVNEYTGGILSFIVVIIGIVVSVVSGQGWVIISLFVILLAVSGILTYLLWRAKLEKREYERFITGEEGFKRVRLDTEQSFSLSKLGPIAGAPFGQVRLGCIPFEILAQDNGIQYLKVKPEPNNAPKTSEILVGIDNVKSIFLLINTNYGLKSVHGAPPGEGWDEKIVGRLELEFQDGSKQIQELRLGHHLRDLHIGNQPYAVDALRSNKTTEIWTEQGKKVALDVLKIDLPKPKFLKRIVVIAQLDVDNFKPVQFDSQKVGPPTIHIYSVTCWIKNE